MLGLGKIISALSGLIVAAVLSAASVSAAPMPIVPTCSLSDVTVSTACEVYDGANDTTAFIASVDPFGITDWTLADKSDGPDGDHNIILKDVVNDVTSGTWSVDSFNGYSSVMLTMKAGNAFVAYLLDVTNLSGTWTTEGVLVNRQGNGRDLSHMSLYYSPDSLTAVPLPAALPLYAVGLAVLGFFGWRKRKTA